MEKLTELRKKAMQLPLSPGVYIMHDSKDKIIYIGKAKALRNRVSQYFGSQNTHPVKVCKMVSNVDHFEYIVTNSEYEALVLECSLIKQHMPKYNILLKDEKGYHYIKIDDGPYPRISEVKQVKDDGARYLGPYVSSYAVKQAVDEVQKIFMLPTCKKVFPRDFRKSRPCLNFSIKQCMAPCRGNISQEVYNEAVNEAIGFLKGGRTDLIRDLTRRMNEAAENLEFEQAARLRDRINAIKKMSEKQKVVMAKVEEQDVMAIAGNHNGVCFEVFRFSGGKLYDRENFILDEITDEPSARYEFIMRYYSMREPIPPRITLDGEVEDEQLLSEYLSGLSGHKVEITIPKIGEQAQLVSMCKSNAEEHLNHNFNEGGKNISALEELAELLGLSEIPEYIEAYDISNTMGSDNVAAMVVFEKGVPQKSAYRKFKIKGFEGQDDYRSMREVIERRFNEYEKNKENGKGFGRMPDLILLDGGKGHVAAVEPLVRSMGYDVPIFGMVKDNKHRTRAIAVDGGEIEIKNKRKAFSLVYTIQEEVHRFAILYHRTSRKKSTISTSLTSIEGIGENRAKALLKQFKTITRIKEASMDELLSVKGMTEPAAAAVYNFYHSEE